MADAKRAETAASNKDGAGELGPEGALAGYLEWLEGRPLAARSRDAYGHQVRRFVVWLADRSPVDGDPLADEPARDWAVRDYKRHLKAVQRWRPSPNRPIRSTGSTSPSTPANTSSSSRRNRSLGATLAMRAYLHQLRLVRSKRRLRPPYLPPAHGTAPSGGLRREPAIYRRWA
jgi:hypothetical protein